MRNTIVPVMVVGALLIAACSASPGAASAPAATASLAASAAQPSPTPSASPTPSPSPTPEPTPDIQALGAGYLAFADWLRTASFKTNDKLEAAKTDAQYSAAYKDAVAVFVEATARLSKLELLPSLEPERTKYLAALAVTIKEFGLLAADPYYDPGTKITKAQAAVTAAGANIRKALGLPPPTTPKP